MANPYGGYQSSPVDMSSLKDKSVIVTGGASGLGLATAVRFATAGADVTIADVQDAAGERAASDLVAQGHRATFVHCDITKWDSSVAAFRHAANFARSKTIDVAALYAGVIGDNIGVQGLVAAAGPPSLDASSELRQPDHLGMQVNLLGTYDTSFLAMHFMQLPSQLPVPAPAATKSLILMASMAGYYDAPPYSAYNSSKFGVRGLFRCLRHTSASVNVRVNLLAPYWVETPMARSAIPPEVQVNFASIDHVVNAATLCAVDENVAGRAFAIVPEGYSDLRDDEDGGWGGDAMRALWRHRRSQGDLIGLI